MSNDMEEKIANLQAQRKQVKLEISELEDALDSRDKLLNKIDGALEFAESIKDKPKSKKEKQDA